MLVPSSAPPAQPIAPLTLPSRADVTNKRVASFKEKIAEVMNAEGLDFFSQHRCRRIYEEHNVGAEEVAAALAMMAQESKPLQIAGEDPAPPRAARHPPGRFGEREQPSSRASRTAASARASKIDGERSERPRFDDRGAPARKTARPARHQPATWSATGSIVGREHGVEVRDIVGAIANEAGIESRFIGRIGLYEESSTVENCPAGMPA